MKHVKRIATGIVVTMLSVLLIVSCSDQEAIPAEWGQLNSDEKEAMSVIQKAFDQETKKLVTGKKPDLSMFVSEQASRYFDFTVFTVGEYSFEKASGTISEPVITKTTTGYKINLQYRLHKEVSDDELRKYVGLGKAWDDRHEYDFYLEKVDGVYKITKVKLYTDADIPSNYIPLDDEGQMFTGRDLSSNSKARMSYVYNRTAASNYAKSYTIDGNSVDCNGYNTAYKCYPSNDCANLVSQSLKAGGVTFNNAYTSSSSASSWWYNTKNTSTTSDDVASISWTTANGLYNHVTGTGIGSVTSNISQMKLGDLVFAKWVQKSGSTCYYNSSYDHAMIVTALIGNPVRDIKLTYHTNDRKNKILSEIITQSSFNDCAGNYCAVPVITMVKMNGLP